MRHHIIPRIGGIRLDALTPAHIDQLQHTMQTDARLSATSIQQTLTILRSALEHARKVDRLIAVSPVDYIDKMPAVKYRAQQPTPWQVASFLHYLRETGHSLFAAFAFTCFIGCRQGETLGPRWTDIDPATRTVRISRSRTQGAAGTVEQSSRKSGNDYSIPIADYLWGILTAHRDSQRAASGNVVRLDNPGYVFTDRNGDPLPGNALTGALRYLKPRTGLTCRLHDFRGFAASQLFAAGFSPAEVRDIGGWRDATTPLNHYAQPVAGNARKAVVTSSSACIVEVSRANLGLRVNENSVNPRPSIGQFGS